MKANELMLGDYVSHFNEEKKCVVIELRGRKVAVSYTDDNRNTKYSELLPEMAFEPIPLTVEILEKNGFIRKYEIGDEVIWKSEDLRIQLTDDERMHNTYNRWSVHIDTEDMCTMFYCELTYVHEFQHALRFCGIKKTIKL